MPMVDPLPAISETQAFALHEQLLLHRLGQLRNARLSARMRAEIDEWIADDTERPFSFAACARVCGCDPDALREQLAYRLRHRSA